METTRKPRKLITPVENISSITQPPLTPVKPNRFIGLDVTLTCTGFCIFDVQGNFVSSGTVKSKPGSHPLERYNKIMYELFQKINPESTDVFGVEGYSFGSHSGRIADLAELTGILKYKLYYHFLVHTSNIWNIVPTQVKKFATGKGAKVDKNVILKEVYRKWNQDFNSDDEADAFVLGKIMSACFINSTTLTKYEKEVVDAVIEYNTVGPKKSKAKKR
jgi:crossover junction endodeoxyribonuclease RuvC